MPAHLINPGSIPGTTRFPEHHQEGYLRTESCVLSIAGVAPKPRQTNKQKTKGLRMPQIGLCGPLASTHLLLATLLRPSLGSAPHARPQADSPAPRQIATPLDFAPPLSFERPVSMVTPQFLNEPEDFTEVTVKSWGEPPRSSAPQTPHC